MKQAILTILSRLITSMKAESRPYHPLVLPIIKGAVEPGSVSAGWSHTLIIINKLRRTPKCIYWKMPLTYGHL